MATSKRSLVTLSNASNFKLIVVGGGTAGISITSQLAPKFKNDILIIEPNKNHYYQPVYP
jgi:NADH dehydrogenase FAD-containing subunit